MALRAILERTSLPRSPLESVGWRSGVSAGRKRARRKMSSTFPLSSLELLTLTLPPKMETPPTTPSTPTPAPVISTPTPAPVVAAPPPPVKALPPPPKPAPNYTGIPSFSLPKKLPSKNWFIFAAVITIPTALWYDDRQKAAALKEEYLARVRHLANIPLEGGPLGRVKTVSVYAGRWPGEEDGKGAAWFKRYVKVS